MENLTLVAVNELSDSVSILLAMANGAFQPAVNFAVGSIPYFVAVGDFNGGQPRRFGGPPIQKVITVSILFGQPVMARSSLLSIMRWVPNLLCSCSRFSRDQKSTGRGKLGKQYVSVASGPMERHVSSPAG